MNLRPLLSLTVAVVTSVLVVVACSDDDTAVNPTGGNDGGVDSSPPTTTPDAATGDTGSNVDPPKIGPLELTFEARVGSEVFGCGKTFAGIGTSNAAATAGDLRFFVHDIKLLRGTTEVPYTLDVRDPWQSAKLGLLDFEDNTGECEFGTPGTNKTLTGTVLGTGFDGISFTIGVPEDLNHLNKDTQPAPLPGSGLNWSWTSGYIHFAAQLNSMNVVDGGRAPSFFSHVGSSVCSGDPADGGTASCARKNRPQVKLTGFDPTKHKIVVDAKKLFETSNIDVNTPATIPGCMSAPTDPECPAIFTRLGLDINTGASMASAPIFSSEPK